MGETPLTQRKGSAARAQSMAPIPQFHSLNQNTARTTLITSRLSGSSARNAMARAWSSCVRRAMKKILSVAECHYRSERGHRFRIKWSRTDGFDHF
jgi:hypothetical protein